MNEKVIYACPYYGTDRCPGGMSQRDIAKRQEIDEEPVSPSGKTIPYLKPPECKYPFLRIKADRRPICKLAVDIDSPDVIGGLGYLLDKIEFVDRSPVRDMEVSGI